MFVPMLCKSDPKEKNQNKGVEYTYFTWSKEKKILVRGLLLYTMHAYLGTTLNIIFQYFMQFANKMINNSFCLTPNGYIWILPFFGSYLQLRYYMQD